MHAHISQGSRPMFCGLYRPSVISWALQFMRCHDHEMSVRLLHHDAYSAMGWISKN